MTRIIKIERLMRCEGASASMPSPTKGAGIALRNSELRTAAPIEHYLPAGYGIRYGLAVIDVVRTRLERERRLVCRKGIFSMFRGVVTRLPRTWRSRAWS